ncbi:MAG: Cytochrome peroxidase [Labilithrix sp.]|nr:Cytochrome peroxidase [Labilithrix sp.]
MRSGTALTCALALAGVLGVAAGCGDDASSARAGAPAPEPDAGSPPDTAVVCRDGKPTTAWPAGPYGIALGATLPPDLVYEGPAGPVRLADYWEPCASSPHLLVIRSAPAWCGPCDWHAKHTTRLLGDARYAGRLRLLDLVIADEDNLPATAESAARWASRIDVPPGLEARVGVDVDYKFSRALLSNNVLPEYLLVDTRTMRALNVQSNPALETLQSFLDIELAVIDGRKKPDQLAPPLHDGLLSDDQYDLLQGMRAPAAPPADPTNEVADLPLAASLGKALFEDTALSPGGTRSCVTCHDPAKGFADGKRVAVGQGIGDRNSPSIALAAHARWQFWDGRADTLWMQALGPFENDRELASSRLFVARAIAERHASEYAAVFGAKYPLPDFTGLPASGRPGMPAYDALPEATRDAVTRVFVNGGKAIAAFERTLRVAPNKLDRYIDGDLTALGPAERKGLVHFFNSGCAQCHHGPRLTDDAFHAVGFGTGRADAIADEGRLAVLADLPHAEFLASSRWSDAPAAAPLLPGAPPAPVMLGAFKTPTLRGIPATGPYGHGGTFATLAEVTRHYGRRGRDVPAGQSAGTVEAWLPLFDETVQADLPAFLDVLTAEAAP